MTVRSILRFAFDIGTNSIGWVVLLGTTTLPAGATRQGQATEIIGVKALGARIYSDGRSPKDGSSLAMMRRVPKAARRRRDRYLQRQRKLIRLLIEHGLLPAEEGARKKLERLDPYALRTAGLDRALEPFEFGRALFHLNQRRGFQSNRKADAKDKESGVLKEAAKRLAEQLEHDGSRTLGEFLHRRLKTGNHARFRLAGVGTKAEHEFYPTRDLVRREFDALWSAQAAFDPERLTPDVKCKIAEAIFHQRKLKDAKPGRCTLNPHEERLPAALPSVQARRIYQQLNELRFGPRFRLDRQLTREQREPLAATLLGGKSLTWDQIRKALKLDSEILFSREEIDEKIEGCETARRLVGSAKKKAFGNVWRNLPLERKDEIVSRLLTEEDEESLIAWLRAECGLDAEAASNVAGMSLPDGHGRLGKTANAEVLAELKAAVITYAKAAENAGYHHSDFSTEEKLDRLPYYARVLERHVAFGTGEPEEAQPGWKKMSASERRRRRPAWEEKCYGRIANPTVHIGLNQLRRIVNELIAVYGKPDEVVLELARELKLNKKQKDDIERKNRENRTANDRRKKQLAECGVEDNGLNRTLLRLWEEQRDGLNSVCPYSRNQIGIEQLFSEEIEIDHILPFSRTLDDSAANKVVCFRNANREKRNRTPHEAFGYRNDWSAIEANAEKLPYNKRWRFAPDAMERFDTRERDFLDRQLNETKHLSRVAKEYLECVAPDVWAVTGNLTSLLRHKWGLNSILGDDRKNRDDHRHHAIDAAAIGCISRSILNRLAQRAGESESSEERGRIADDIPDPYPTFRDDVRELVRKTIVSHKPEHAKGGALHEDTAYGLVRDEAERQIGNLVYRKALTALTPKEIERVRDTDLRKKLLALRDAVQASGEKLEAALIAFAQAEAHAEQERTGKPRNPIRHVRLLKPEATNVEIEDRRNGKPYKAVVPSENWCMDVVSLKDGNGGHVWKGFAASLFEVNQKGWRPQWERDRIGGKLVMRLHKGDFVEIDDKDGERRIKKVVRLSPSNGIVYLVGHNEAGELQKRHDDPEDPFRWDFANIGGMRIRNAQKIAIDELGCIANKIRDCYSF
ncbi:type II CRISPR RNA-guided endonuclease Cas9 [Methylosinus sp. Ce-a6]|uniref:type II CRISPR RNA-guided endonuclease Cas9 n=1 Tax=Methylosinus sp. Ce-a6 TaxID=2172005 RepID=UPI001359F66A|nr:type II CRISPR RNA-guided endonuclease Cas9 [Methylosinus sp. Ce-a6]